MSVVNYLTEAGDMVFGFCVSVSKLDMASLDTWTLYVPDLSESEIAKIMAISGLEREVERLRAALTAIVDAYPHLNCVCGRTKPRMLREMRHAALVALGKVAAKEVAKKPVKKTTKKTTKKAIKKKN